MNQVVELLDEAKLRVTPQTDQAVAKALKVTKQAVSNWRVGRTHPDEVAAARLARLIDRPLYQVIGIVGEARAVSATAKAVWRKIAQGAASAILIGAATLPAPTHANGALSDTWGDSHGLYIM